MGSYKNQHFPYSPTLFLPTLLTFLILPLHLSHSSDPLFEIGIYFGTPLTSLTGGAVHPAANPVVGNGGGGGAGVAGAGVAGGMPAASIQGIYFS